MNRGKRCAVVVGLAKKQQVGIRIRTFDQSYLISGAALSSRQVILRLRAFRLKESAPPFVRRVTRPTVCSVYDGNPAFVSSAVIHVFYCTQWTRNNWFIMCSQFAHHVSADVWKPTRHRRSLLIRSRTSVRICTKSMPPIEMDKNGEIGIFFFSLRHYWVNSEWIAIVFGGFQCKIRKKNTHVLFTLYLHNNYYWMLCLNRAECTQRRPGERRKRDEGEQTKICSSVFVFISLIVLLFFCKFNIETKKKKEEQ